MVAIILMMTLLSAFSPAETQGGSNWRTFKGAWFEIRYPSTFKATPSLRSSSASGYDSVFVTAPDDSVEFYVFSPQWNGDPRDIELKPSEVLVSNTVERKGSLTIRRVAMRARNNSYYRAFEDTEDSATNTRKVFGIKYRNQASYNQYRQIYLTFKQSLRQFAD